MTFQQGQHVYSYYLDAWTIVHQDLGEDRVDVLIPDEGRFKIDRQLRVHLATGYDIRAHAAVLTERYRNFIKWEEFNDKIFIDNRSQEHIRQFEEICWKLGFNTDFERQIVIPLSEGMEDAQE